jgi:hypothetical protein
VLPLKGALASTDIDWPRLLDAFAQDVRTPWSGWSTTGSPRVAAGAFACRALPPHSAYASMLDGQRHDGGDAAAATLAA